MKQWIGVDGKLWCFDGDEMVEQSRDDRPPPDLTGMTPYEMLWKLLAWNMADRYPRA